MVFPNDDVLAGDVKRFGNVEDLDVDVIFSLNFRPGSTERGAVATDFDVRGEAVQDIGVPWEAGFGKGESCYSIKLPCVFVCKTFTEQA